MRLLRLVTVASILLIGASAASAKDFRRGDLRLCGAVHCRVVTPPEQLRAFGSFLYGDGRVTRAPTPRPGSPVVQLRFRNGFVAAILTATAIRAQGLYCGRFIRGRWYRLPQSLEDVAAGLEPKRLRARVPRSC